MLCISLLFSSFYFCKLYLFSYATFLFFYLEHLFKLMFLLEYDPVDKRVVYVFKLNPDTEEGRIKIFLLVYLWFMK